MTNLPASGMMMASAQQQSNPYNPCTSANPCTQQICGDHVCARGEYEKLQQALAQAQIQSSKQNPSGMQYYGVQNTTMQNMTVPNTTVQNMTMQNMTVQNTTSGVVENKQTIPEFGPIASLVLVIAVVGVITVTAKIGKF